jgi:hypothetical protein
LTHAHGHWAVIEVSPRMNRTRYYALLALIAATIAITIIGGIMKGGPAGDTPDDGARAPRSHGADR